MHVVVMDWSTWPKHFLLSQPSVSPWHFQAHCLLLCAGTVAEKGSDNRESTRGSTSTVPPVPKCQGFIHRSAAVGQAMIDSCSFMCVCQAKRADISLTNWRRLKKSLKENKHKHDLIEMLMLLYVCWVCEYTTAC